MEDLLPDFLAETSESLEKLDIELIQLESQPDDKPTLSSIFRSIHTIKGTCGFLGLARLEKVAHATESVLDQHRNGAIAVTAASITLILRALDGIRAIVDGLRQTGKEPDGDDAPLIAELIAAAAGKVGAAATPAAASDPDVATPVMATTQAAPVAPASPRPVEAAPTPPVPAQRVETAASAAVEPAVQTVRVNVDVLEGLMTLVSELVLTRNQILQLARTQDSNTFAAPLQRLSHITSDLQEGVMKTRMQPIGNAWNNLPRLVRDLARELDKNIELVALGAETELDRQILELIKDPLTHMVRNSADHGLESPADRRAAGKPEQGRIRLSAFHEGGHIVIRVDDDGRGLPVERIRNKIIANGLATEAEIASLTDQQIQAFIFRAGFSTASAVTSVSGRGVGMDVVKTNIERIGGTVDVTSVEGAGTTFTVKIPLTLAIVSALIVEVSGERYAIPQINVVELVRAQTSRSAGVPTDGRASDTMIELINEAPVLRLRGHLLALVDLSDLLKLRERGPQQGGAEITAESLYIAVVQVGASRFGLIVDRVFDTEEIVVKPVAPILRHIPLFSGNTILGDGSVIVILDPNGIARATGIGIGLAGADADEVVVSDTQSSTQKMALLLFKMGDAQSKAVPLNQVSRLETVERAKIEYSGGQLVMQYRGKLMPLVGVGPSAGGGAQPDPQPVLVFADGNRAMGLMVDEIQDVVEDHLQVELSTDRPGFLGTAIVAGRATDVLDTSFWLQQAFKDWFGANRASRTEPQLLIVEDSAFFRSLIIPALSAAGFHVTAVDNPMAALEMRDAGKMFDVILSDIEMPEMDGLAFVREIRAQGSWAKLPVVALSSSNSPEAVKAGREAGFDNYLSKFDKTAMIEAVGAALSAERVARRPRRQMADQDVRA
ncbi:MAG: hybrid sensor histidine kinase/response regulator [Acetobacteraceae bacterium]|nr:hybrid sensor histidine kinase/response regulator [Acetobacteraceae bacterium]